MRILVVQTAFIGDVILITPLIRSIKSLFPNHLIDVLVIPQTAGILQNNPNVDKIIHFEKRKKKLKNFISTLIKLKKKKYEICFLPHSSFTTALLVFWSKIKIRIGFGRWLAARFLTIRIPFENGKHRIEKNLDLLSVFCKNKLDNQTELFPGKKSREKADVIFRRIKREKRLIAIAPGSVWNTKRWPEEYYIILAQLLVKNDFCVILIGSSQEKKLCEKILPKGNVINLAGETSILESAVIIEMCDLLICNDSGALHIANAMKTDVFTFFGPTVKSIGYYPYRENDHVFETELDCRPCGSHGAHKCPLNHHLCMKNIEPEIVLNKIVERFRNKVEL